MKKTFFGALLGCCLAFSLSAQSDISKNYRNFPIVLTLQFHSLTLPFKDLKSNFTNVGLGLGTELSFSGKQNWVQQVGALWYRNKTVGNGLLFYTQTAWRPSLSDNFYTELKIGAAYLLAFRPVDSFRYSNGEWTPAGRKGRGLLALPLGISLGYQQYSAETYLSPFVSYQFMLVKGYNKSIPLVPETLLQIGSRVHFKK